MSLDAKIIIAVHKNYQMPKGDLYLPLHVGAALHPDAADFQPDDTGQNISKLNTSFCELTGLYWAWKNLDAKYIGLVHYRRYFALKTPHGRDVSKRLSQVLNQQQLGKLLKSADVVLPKKRNYFIETLYSHYAHTMHVKPLDMTGKIIADKFPEYLAEFERLKDRTSAHMFNMFVMKKEILDDYCDWLFEILFELQKQVEKKGLKFDDFHARFYGRISELLLDVYLETHHINYVEAPVINIEPVNWVKKGGSFLAAKFLKKKYKKSF